MRKDGSIFYGKGIDMRWDYDTILWKQVDRTLESINTGDEMFLNHVEALIRLVTVSSFIGNRKADDSSYDDISKRYEKRMKMIDKETSDSLRKRPNDQRGIHFDAGLRKLNAIINLLDDRKITPQRQEHAII